VTDSRGRLVGKVAVVTGAGRGIGRAVAKALAAQGAHVVVNNRTEDAAHAVVEEVTRAGGSAIPHRGDVGRTSDANDLVELAHQTWGRLDILVNNAGQTIAGTIVDATDDDFDDIVRVHLRGTFNMSRAAARHWVARRDYGRLINMVSRGGIDGIPTHVAYAAAKAGIIGLTRSSASALVAYNVTCNCVVPTAATQMLDGMDIAKDHFERTGRWPSEVAEGTALDPANVAPLIIYLASEAAANVSGRIFGARGLTYTLYNELEECASLTADGEQWDVDRLFDEFPTTLGEGLTATFSYYLDDIAGPVRLHPPSRRIVWRARKSRRHTVMSAADVRTGAVLTGRHLIDNET